MKLLTVQLPPFSRHLIPPRSKYSSQNPVLSPQSGNFYHLNYYQLLKEDSASGPIKIREFFTS
jgi:hypothetical protein